MKSIISILAFITVSHSAFAAPLAGKIVSKNKANQSVYLECSEMEGATCSLAVVVTEVNGVKKLHEQWTVPMGNDFDSYAQRWGTFNEISTEASIRMPLIPEMRYLLLVNLSMKSYREAFKAIEPSDKSMGDVSVRDLFFEKLLEAIDLQ